MKFNKGWLIMQGVRHYIDQNGIFLCMAGYVSTAQETYVHPDNCQDHCIECQEALGFEAANPLHKPSKTIYWFNKI